jgi:hypothetical protein
MTRNINKGPRPRFLFAVISVIALLLVLTPVALSNRPKQAILGILALILLFFFPGSLLMSFLRMPIGVPRVLVGLVLGIVSVTTAYDVSARVSMGVYFPYLVAVFSLAGIALLLLHARRSSASSQWSREDYEAVLAGAVVTLSIAPLYWRSGRFSGSEYVFYGPAGQDPLFHVTLMQRLLHHVPPDNFIVSGLAPPVYHYFDDLALAFSLAAQYSLHLGTTEIFDLYYRCYPTVLYFLLGALAYSLGRRLLGKVSGGILSVLLLLGAGGLGWIVGVLRTLFHASHPEAMRIAALSEWSSSDGVDAILPLVHRPAHYHSLLICLAVMNVLLVPERTRRHWVVSGVLLGLMAGFNFTLAATFGIAAVLASFILWSQGQQDEACDLGWLAFSLFIGSLPVLSAMLLSGFHNPAPGFPFRGPNLEFTTGMWGATLSHVVPRMLVPWVSLMVFPIVAYGIKLFGLGPLLRFDMGESRHRGIAMMFAIVLACSFVIGTFFPYNALGGVAIIFIQPTLWVLGLFALRPIHAWMERNRTTVWLVALWGVLAVSWLQALGSFNFSYRAAFSQEAVQAFHDIRWASSPDQVVAFLPSDLIERPLWGDGSQSTNFAITALTGMDGYFSSEAYTTSFAVSGLQGRDPAQALAAAKLVYQQRRRDVESFLKGDISDGASERLAKDHVCWIVVSGDAVPPSSSTAIPWRQTRDLTIYRLFQ